jgi:N utilization substance protein A
MTEADESKMRVEDFAAATKLFTTALDVEDVIAELLASEGFRKVEEVAQAQPGEIAAIEGFDDDVEAELIRRAATFLQDERERMEAELRTLGVSPALLELPGMSSAILTALGKQGVKTLDDVADLSRDEFKEFVPGAGLPNKEIDRMIMAARAHWFEDEEGKEAVNG